jgi:HIP---CoA ligase
VSILACTVDAGPGVGNSTMPGVLVRALDRHGSAPWMAFDGQVQTFGEMGGHVAQIAAALIAAGIAPGDGVALFMSNRFEWLQAQFAVSDVGAWLLPLNTWLRTRELEHIIASSGCRAIVWHGAVLGKDTRPLLADLVPELDDGRPGDWRSARFPDLAAVIGLGDGPWPVGVTPWDEFLAAGASTARADVVATAAAVGPTDTGMIIYTSGTTGTPKGAVLTHTGIVDHIREWARHLGVSNTDRSIMGSPLFWVWGCTMNGLVPLLSGAMLVLQERFEAGRFLADLHHYGVTHLQGVPDQYELLLRHPQSRQFDLSTLRIVQLGGSKMSPTLVQRLLERAPAARMTTSYGLTEGVGVNTWTGFNDPNEMLGTSIGRPAPDNEIVLRDPETFDAVEVGQVGEMWLKGPHVMKEYHGDPVATAAAMVEGYFRTGDLAVADEQGYLTIKGRRAHTYKRGGMNVYPAEAELLIVEHPAVAQVAIIGVPDGRLGQVGAAFVVLTPAAQLTPEELLGWCEGRLAQYKLPQHVRIVSELPLTGSGKIKKFELEATWSVHALVAERGG